MEALGFEQTDKNVCSYCKRRFICFTTRGVVPQDGLCSDIGLRELSYEQVKQIQIAKAKKQGRYFPTGAG